MDQPNLTRELLRHAQRMRQPVRLAMAFKSQNPDWGSQATLVSIGVAGLLHDLDWNLSQVSTRFPEWHEEARVHHDPHLLLLRATQSHALSLLVENPHRVRFRPVDQATSEQHFWHLLAAHGLTLHDARQLAGFSALHPRVHEWLPDITRNVALHELWAMHHEDLPKVTLDAYLEAVHPEDQRDHPNVLFHSVVQHWRNLGRLADPFLDGARGQPAEAPTLLPNPDGERRKLPRRGLKA